ncbi:hypothetical protein PAALTS15_03057 [Paenibacillus alvei TS-15]|uniref:M23ase beta-sheet core domain-containing protein n=1 Tax=Paenibacillus alvei TS-15 TaxID=1117108 RepID=S9UEJ9_PAEAL|nr:M23 family metallopeptidase [Paenibacillus alvei]EPY08915.1 hypothetical protein PAALTS15_03057 [Paenibacillus alvei TS-15]
MKQSISKMVLLTVCLAISMTSPSIIRAELESRGEEVRENVDRTVSVQAEPTEQLKPELIAKWVKERNGAQLYHYLSKELKQAVPEGYLPKLLQAMWKEGEQPTLVAHKTFSGIDTYVWTDATGLRGVQTGIAGNQIVTLQMYPLHKWESDQHPTKQSYKPPFTGDWFVFWGGNNEFMNYHYESLVQRYSYDLVIQRDGYSYNGDPAKNESYYAFGQPVVAPRDGTVVRVENNIADNTPVGVMNEKEMAGNYVVIDHGNGEYSMLAHLKKGSIAMKKGDVVKQGQQLGECGNSGNSSEPHIHFQVSDTPQFEEGMSIRIRFDGGIEPVFGQTIKGQSPLSSK